MNCSGTVSIGSQWGSERFNRAGAWTLSAVGLLWCFEQNDFRIIWVPTRRIRLFLPCKVTQTWMAQNTLFFNRTLLDEKSNLNTVWTSIYILSSSFSVSSHSFLYLSKTWNPGMVSYMCPVRSDLSWWVILPQWNTFPFMFQNFLVPSCTM